MKTTDRTILIRSISFPNYWIKTGIYIWDSEFSHWPTETSHTKSECKEVGLGLKSRIEHCCLPLRVSLGVGV